MASTEEDQDLALPEQDFKYNAGSTDRPWSHFTGRWKAIKPILAEMLQECGTERPLRIVDLGSCTGFFSLQAAHRHPEADIVAVEGSVGVGNGTVGTVGSSKQILGTDAVQTHLRWIQRLGLSNCFVAPEVWDYSRITELVQEGRPICDVMLMLSVIHHVDGISTQQYAAAGHTRLDGLIKLMGKMLLLSPRHFVELPNRPWISCAYDAYGSQRSILEAAAKASGRQWRFKGPIYSVDWFGQRELWVIEAAAPMAPVDVMSCPFPFLYRGDGQDAGPLPEEDLLENLGLGAYDDLGDGLGDMLGDGGVDDLGGHACNWGSRQLHGVVGAAGYEDSILDPAFAAAKHFGDPDLSLPLACPHLGGSLVDPGLMTLTEPCAPAEGRVGEALNMAPTALLLAHLALREAVGEACAMLSEVRSAGLLEETAPGQGGEAAAQPARGPPMAPPPRGRAGFAGAGAAGGAAAAVAAARRDVLGGGLARAAPPMQQMPYLQQY